MANSNHNPEPTGARANNASEQDFAVKLMEHMVVPTFVLDANGLVIIWNQACERLTCIPASEVIGTRGHWRAFYHEPRPTLADLVVQGRADEVAVLYARREGQAEYRNAFSVESWCDMPQRNARLYLAIDSGPIYDNAGELVAVVETVRDLTVQKEAELTLERLATRDRLTGLTNRRCFDGMLDEEWRRTMRDAQPLSLLMVDVDNFSRYNATHGRLAGDDCLKRIARVIEGEVRRAGDTVARYGDEEFAVILPNQGHRGAAAVAERIRLAVEQLGLPEAHLQAHETTVSVGVATATNSLARDATPLLYAADAALHEAKHAGRNRVIGAEAAVR